MTKVLPLLIFVFVMALSATTSFAQSATGSATSSATSTSSSTTTTTTTKGGVEMPDELPESGSVNYTFLIITAGILLLGIGFYAKYALALVLEEE